MQSNCNIMRTVWSEIGEIVSQCEIFLKNLEFVTNLSYLVFTILGEGDKINEDDGDGFYARNMRIEPALSPSACYNLIGGYKHGKKDEVHGR